MDIIEKVKNIINGYYVEQSEKMYIPEDIVEDVFALAAANSHTVEQFLVLHNDAFDSTMFRCGAEYAKRGAKVRQHLAINNAKQLEGCKDYLLADKGENYFQGIALLSNTNMELMPELISFSMFDDKFVIVLEYDDNGGFYVTRREDILGACRKWLSVKIIDRPELDAAFLQEPLMMSADMMSEVSTVLCSHDHMNMDSCCWYHSVWQYLRLMNMVSTPTWHHDFYTDNLRDSLCDISSPRILISGTADYSSLSYVMRAMELLGKTGSYDVLDLCATPLFACKWYAKRKSASVGAMQMSIFDLQADGIYDLICTDAFLTRFTKDQISTILCIWYRALKPDGNVVTTVRVHDERHPCPDTPTAGDIAAFSTKASERSKIWGRVINYSSDEIAGMAGVYASKMKSNKIGTRDDILTAFTDAGFALCHVEDVEVAGELYPSRYLRIRARKSKKNEE